MRPSTAMYRGILEKYPLFFRTSCEMAEERDSGHTKSGCLETEQIIYVFAPLVISFTGWVLNQAMSRGIQRLYFLARDGYQFYRCAQTLKEDLDLPVEVRYLACSRYSLRVPCFYLMGDGALDYVCLRGMEVSFADMMGRAGLSKDEAREIADAVGYAIDIYEPIPLNEIPRYAQRLKDCPLFMEKMERVSREAYGNAIGYFSQEGLLEDIPWAIVDSGWTGTTQQVLEELLNSAVKDPAKKIFAEGFYWGLFDLPREANPSRYHTFYFSWKGNLPWQTNLRRKVEFSNSLFEAIFSAPHGMTVRYEKTERNGHICFTPHYNKKRGLQAETIDDQTALILEYTRRWLKNQGSTGGVKNMAVGEKRGIRCLSDNRPMVRMIYQMLRCFMARPSTEEAEVYGNYRFSDDVTEERTHPMALPLSEEELSGSHILERIARLYVRKDLPVKESAWYEGSAALYSKRAPRHWRHYRRYKALIYLRKGAERKLRK